MNHESLSSDSFDEENIISRASPKSYEQANQPARSRFSILADINEAGIFSKKNEEQSLLSKYMKDLHQQQTENPTKNASNQGNLRDYASEQHGKEAKKGQHMKSRQPNQHDWKRKNGAHCQIDNSENINNSNSISQSSRTNKRQNESYGIFVYKMKIDLNRPIDFSTEEYESIHRNYGQSRNTSKLHPKEKSQEDMLFGRALRQHYHSKNGRF